MFQNRIYALSLFLILAAPLVTATERPELDPPMRQVFHSLMNLQPFAMDEARFRDPQNRDTISRDLKIVVGLNHQLPGKIKALPAMAPILSEFSSYAKDMEEKFKQGDYDYVRHRVRTVTGFCLACHTREAESSDFADVNRRVEMLQVSPFQKAEFYASTRQFDKALTSFRLLLDEKPKDGLGILDFTRGLRHALNIAVRVKQDPKWTLELLNRLSTRKDLPAFDQDFIKSWKKDAEYWSKDQIVSKDLTGEALVRKASALIERAQSLQSFPTDENGDVSYLRANGYLNEALDRDTKASYRGQALYLLGVTYGILQEPYLWDLDTLYFEACIREYPHSALSRKCYRRYSEKAYREAEDSSLSESDLRALEDLRKKSE